MEVMFTVHNRHHLFERLVLVEVQVPDDLSEPLPIVKDGPGSLHGSLCMIRGTASHNKQFPWETTRVSKRWRMRRGCQELRTGWAALQACGMEGSAMISGTRCVARNSRKATIDTSKTSTSRAR
jgi:hypothetical protein